jgi:hypothetical protein
MMTWLGAEFGPDAFDPVGGNRALANLRWARPATPRLAKVLNERDGYWP